MSSAGPAVELAELLEKLHVVNREDNLSSSGNGAPPPASAATPTAASFATGGTASQQHQPFADFSVWASRQTPQGNRSPTTAASAASRHSPGSHTPVNTSSLGTTSGLPTGGHAQSVSPPPRFSADSFHHTSSGPTVVVSRGPLPVLHTPPRGGGERSNTNHGGGTHHRKPQVVAAAAVAAGGGDASGSWGGRSGSVASETTFDAMDRIHGGATVVPQPPFVVSGGNQTSQWFVVDDVHRGVGATGAAVTPPHHHHIATGTTVSVSARAQGSAASPIGLCASPIGQGGGGGATAPHRVGPGQSESPLGNWQSTTPSCRSTSPGTITGISGTKRLSPSAPLFTPPQRSPGAAAISTLHPQPTALDALSPSLGDGLSFGHTQHHSGGSLFASVGHQFQHAQHSVHSASQTPASSGVSGSVTPQQPQPGLSLCGSTLGQYFDAAKDQFQCRALQRAMETLPFDSPEIQGMVTELAPRLAELMIDPYGNFLVQKILEWAPDDYRLALVTSLSPCLAHIATAAHGTFAVQKLIESLRNDLEAQIVASGLALHLPLLMNDVNGGHVLNKVLHCLPPERRHFLYFGIASHALEVCNDKQGCCAVQRCIAAATKEQFLLVQQAVLDPVHLLFITCNPYGNYVVSRLLERGTALLNDDERQAQLMTVVQTLISYQSTQLAGELRRLRSNLNPSAVPLPAVVLPNTATLPSDSSAAVQSGNEQHILVMLCENKFSSNVMENVMRLSVGTPAFAVLLATIVETERRPLEILFAGCGNYIIQCALTNCPVAAVSTAVDRSDNHSSSATTTTDDYSRASGGHPGTTTATTTTGLLVALVESLLPAMTLISSQNFGKNVEGAVADALERLFLAGYRLREGLQIPHVIHALLAARNCTAAAAFGAGVEVLHEMPHVGRAAGGYFHGSPGSVARTPPRTSAMHLANASAVSPSHPQLRGMGSGVGSAAPAMPSIGDTPTPPRLRPQKRGHPQQHQS